MLLRCTQKFLTELRLKKSDITKALAVLHPLDEWYAHLFFLYPRRKCAIFMHAQTKFCFFAYDKNRDQLNDIRGLFRSGLGRALFDEHYPEPVIRLFNERLEDIQVGLAQDRRILGFINQRVQELKFTADYHPQDRRVRDEGISGLALRRTPMVQEKLTLAIEQIREVLLHCVELQGVEIQPADYKHEELEKFFQALLIERNGPPEGR